MDERSQTTDLKPCPFCGSDAELTRGGDAYVTCAGCGAEGAWFEADLDRGKAVQQAIASWNRRVPA